MVHTIRLDHLEYKEAILDGPEFREKLRKHEKHISDTSKSIKILLKKFEDVITASEVLRNAQDSFSSYLKEFQLGFVGDTNEEESDIVDTLDSTYNLVQEIKEFSTKMINTGHALFRQLDNFRKEKIDNFKEKKKEYERQTIRYCTVNEKFLTSSQSSKKDRSLLGNEDSSDFRDNDREVKEENQAFYRKCLEYILCIQEFEEKWFHFFAESIFAFIQSWTTFYHEGYEKHCDHESRLTKSNGGIQALRLNFEYFKSRSLDMIADILKSPEFHINSFQTMSNEHFVPTSKQGYLYLIEKKTLGTSTRVKQFCKYYKETKRLEVIPFNQITNKMHPTEYYTVVSCQKSNTDKRFVLDVSLKEKNYSNVHIYQAMSIEDFKSWFAAMEGKELTPVLSPPYPLKNDPVYSLDRNGINFIKKCIKILEDEKINEEGIYRKNGVSHKINQFIERNFVNLAASTITPSSYSTSNSLYGFGTEPAAGTNETTPSSSSSSSSHNTNSHHSLFSSVIKSTVNNFYLLSHSSSSSTLNASKNEPSSSASASASSHHSNHQDTPCSLGQQQHGTMMTRNNSNTNLSHHSMSSSSHDLEDTCTITSALKHYLIHLKEPLMTYHFNQQFLNSCRKENLKDRIVEIHRLLHMLPPLNLEVLEALIKHLYRVSTHSSVNKMTASNLSTCFGPTIFRTEQECVSNLYNIKFYSEIIELLMLHHEKIFEKSLDDTFLNNLTPLKTPVTMTGSGPMNILSPVAKNPSPVGGGTSSSSSSIISSSTPNTKLRSTNSISLNPINRRAIYEPSYKNMLMNSSKTSVSSDSSQSDREAQLMSSSQNINLGQLSSTLSSSLTYMSSQNNNNSNRNAGSTSTSYMTPLKTLTSPNTPAKAVNGTPQSGKMNTPSQSSQMPVKKPYNSQTGPFQRDLDQKLNNSYNNLSASSSSAHSNNNNNKYSQSQTQVTQFGVNNVNMNNNLSLSHSPNKSSSPTNKNNNSSSTPSPLNSKSTPSTATNTSTASLSLSLASSAVSPLTTLDGTKLKRARTLYPCEADNPSELSFDANVIIYNIRRSKESGWLEGTLNGKSGLVPGNYVQILDD